MPMLRNQHCVHLSHTLTPTSIPLSLPPPRPYLVAEKVFQGDDVLVLTQVPHDSHLPQDVLRVDAKINTAASM